MIDQGERHDAYRPEVGVAHRKATFLTAVVATAIVLSGADAQAAWSARTEGPDVFGQTTVVVATQGEQQSMVIQCNDQDKLFVALLFEKKKFEEIPTVPAELLLQVDGGSPIQLAAEVRSWNDNYMGVVAEGRTSEVIGAIRAIGIARQRISAGVSVAGNRESAEFEAEGSTSAVAEAFKGCKLGTAGHQPAS